MKQRILVWDFPTRIFHWLLAASFIVAFVTHESERLRNLHMLAGYLMLALLAFRIVWGIVGSRHARFGAFVRGPQAVLRYLGSLATGRPEHHVGHNPAGALAVVVLIVLGFATGISGWLSLRDIGGELHEGVSNLMMAVVVVHILGVVVSSLLHRENLVGAMVSGYKQGPDSEKIARGHSFVAVALVAALGVFGWNLAQGRIPALMDTAGVTAGNEQHSGERERHEGHGKPRERHAKYARDDD